MKVCFITNYLPLYHHIWGGAEQACLSLIKGFRDFNIDITIITNETNSEIRNYKILFLKRNITRNLFIRAFNKFTKPNYYNRFIIPEFRKIIKNIEPDLVHLHNFGTFSISIIKEIKRLNIPVVLSIYDYWPICPNGLLMYRLKEPCRKFHGIWCRSCLKDGSFGNYSYINALERVLFKGHLRFVDRFIVLSANSLNVLNSYGIPREKIEIIPLPLYESINVNNNVEEGLILFVGWLSANKGLHIIIEALPRILKDFPKARLWIAETGCINSYKEYIFSLIDKLSLRSNINFLGKLKPDELKDVLKKINVVVMPEQWQNPGPLILCEAINLRKPVVASRIGGIPEIIDMDEFLAQPKSPYDFSDKILWILKNKEKALLLADSLNLKVSRIFEPKANLDRIIDLYRRLIK